MRHVIAPLFIELGEALEFLLELLVGLGAILDGGLCDFLLDDGVGLNLLLDEIAQLQHGGLQDLETLLKLWGQNLLLRQGLNLLHAMGHIRGIIRKRERNTSKNRAILKSGVESAPKTMKIRPMRILKFMAVCGLLAGAANIYLGPAQAQQTASVADIQATGAAILTLQDQQKEIVANQGKIDEKLASIAENVRVARLYSARVK